MKSNDASAELGELITQCKTEAENAHRRGRNYYKWTYGVMVVSVLASIASGVGVLASDEKLFGVMALLPALCALAVAQLKLVEKTGWFYRKQRELNALARQVTVARKRSPDVDTLEKCYHAFTELERSIGEEWSRTAAFRFGAQLKDEPAEAARGA
jgi:hypothetical protein